MNPAIERGDSLLSADMTCTLNEWLTYTSVSGRGQT
jgi:hypothetical protein